MAVCPVSVAASPTPTWVLHLEPDRTGHSALVAAVLTATSPNWTFHLELEGTRRSALVPTVLTVVFGTDSREWDPTLVLTTVPGVDSRTDPTLVTLVLTTALEIDRSREDPIPVAMVLATVLKSQTTVLKSQSWARNPTLIVAASTKYPETD